MEREEVKVGGKGIVIETGHVAGQADGAVVVRQGETAVLVTAVMEEEVQEGIDFLPLTVDYRERPSAYGRIPGGFYKREGKPTDREILVSRLTDRSIRPLFPEGFFHNVVITALTLSADDKYDPDALCITGASCALHLSRIPFEGPVAGVRVCRVDGEFLINPTYEERQKADLELVVAGTKDSIVMVEGGGKEVKEEDFANAIFFALENLKPLIEAQEKLREKLGKEKFSFQRPTLDEEVLKEMEESLRDKVLEAFKIQDKRERNKAISQILEEFLKGYPEELHFNIKYFFKRFESKLMREKILKEGIRIDGRKPNEIRPISIKVHPFERPHGSALFKRGQTQAYVTVTLGSRDEAQLIETIFEGESFKRFMLHYNFPPFSSGEARPWGPPRRREIGHGALAERALEPLIPPEEEFPYIIRVVSDILESNGSTSMATVCGASLALFDAGVPLKKHVGGIAMGLIKEGENFVILSDILGDEDHLGDMDFKVAGTKEGITAVQMDIKVKGITKEIMLKALEQAREGRLHILKKMYEVIGEPRKEVSDYAPKIVIHRIPEEKGPIVIGPGGKNIRDIYEKTNVKVWVGEEGKVYLTGKDLQSIEEAKKIIDDLIREVEVGEVYEGEVVRVEPYGAFIEILPGKVGLLHVSKMGQKTKYSVGEKVKVKVLEIDELGRPKFATLDLEEKPLKVGQTYEGEITRVEPYGVFVKVGSKIGLLHRSKMKRKVLDATRVFKVGQRVKVVVEKIEEDGKVFFYEA